MKKIFRQLRDWLAGLSFKTGMWVLGACVACYLISFGQMALPIGVAWKGALWVVFFGLAKALQYSGLLILGKEGIRRLKLRFKKKEIA